MKWEICKIIMAACNIRGESSEARNWNIFETINYISKKKEK